MVKITAKMRLGEIVTKWPKAMHIMLKYGLPFYGCNVPYDKSLKKATEERGVKQKELTKMVEELNSEISD